GTVLGNMGVQASNLGAYPLSHTLFEEALQIAREVNDQTGININMLNLAGVLSHMSNTDDDLSRYDEAVQGAQETGDQPLMGYILNGKVRTLLVGNRLPEAKVVLRQALDLRVELGQLHLAAETRAYLSEAMAADGDIPAALI